MHGIRLDGEGVACGAVDGVNGVAPSRALGDAESCRRILGDRDLGSRGELRSDANLLPCTRGDGECAAALVCGEISRSGPVWIVGGGSRRKLVTGCHGERGMLCDGVRVRAGDARRDRERTVLCIDEAAGSEGVGVLCGGRFDNLGLAQTGRVDVREVRGDTTTVGNRRVSDAVVCVGLPRPGYGNRGCVAVDRHRHVEVAVAGCVIVACAPGDPNIPDVRVARGSAMVERPFGGVGELLAGADRVRDRDGRTCGAIDHDLLPGFSQARRYIFSSEAHGPEHRPAFRCQCRRDLGEGVGFVAI